MMSAVWRDPAPLRHAGRSCTAKTSLASTLWRFVTRHGGRAISSPRSKALPSGRIADAFARRFGTRRQMPDIISTEALASELGAWARGYALDQRLSGAKARRDLGWRPQHVDPEREIARLP